MKSVSIRDCQRLFCVTGMPYLVSDIWSVHYRKLRCLLTFTDNVWTSYLPKEVIEKCLDEGVQFYGNTKFVNDFQESFDLYRAQTTEFFEKVLQKESLLKDDVSGFFEHAANLFPLYSKTEFFYTDSAFLQSKHNYHIAENLKRLELIKNTGREFLNKIFFGSDSYLAAFLQRLEKQFFVEGDDVLWYSMQDVLDLFEGKQVDQRIVSDRRANYFLNSDASMVEVYEGPDAATRIHDFIQEMHVQNTEHGVEGRTAHPGKASGRVRIILFGYDIYEQAQVIMREMKPGEILVAETTSPEFMVACRKAAAIVTDQGGLMSHAAIVSRELNIPCIVATGNATKVLKDGDEVEVDADNGIVRIIKRA